LNWPQSDSVFGILYQLDKYDDEITSTLIEYFVLIAEGWDKQKKKLFKTENDGRFSPV
jgi:hypothetical protein